MSYFCLFLKASILNQDEDIERDGSTLVNMGENLKERADSNSVSGLSGPSTSGFSEFLQLESESSQLLLLRRSGQVHRMVSNPFLKLHPKILIEHRFRSRRQVSRKWNEDRCFHSFIPIDKHLDRPIRHQLVSKVVPQLVVLHG